MEEEEEEEEDWDLCFVSRLECESANELELIQHRDGRTAMASKYM